MVFMKNVSMALTRLCSFTFSSRTNIGPVLLLFVLVFSACGTSTTTNANNATTTSAPTTSVSSTPDTSTSEATVAAVHSGTTTVYPIKVYFSKFPDSVDKQPDAVFPVDRSSPSAAVATFSIQLLIAGPTLSERSAGYFSELNSILSGPSSCSAPHPTGGPDFTLTLNMRGSTAQQGTATLRFCRATSSPGVGVDARILAEINATLKQFSTIKDVVVLTQAGDCFGDESGLNNCLK